MFKKHEENYTQGHHNQMFKTKGKEKKNFESSQKKHITQSLKDSGIMSLKCLKKRVVN